MNKIEAILIIASQKNLNVSILSQLSITKLSSSWSVLEQHCDTTTRVSRGTGKPMLVRRSQIRRSLTVFSRGTESAGTATASVDCLIHWLRKRSAHIGEKMACVRVKTILVSRCWYTISFFLSSQIFSVTCLLITKTLSLFHFRVSLLWNWGTLQVITERRAQYFVKKYVVWIGWWREAFPWSTYWWEKDFCQRIAGESRVEKNLGRGRKTSHCIDYFHMLWLPRVTKAYETSL